MTDSEAIKGIQRAAKQRERADESTPPRQLPSYAITYVPLNQPAFRSVRLLVRLICPGRAVLRPCWDTRNLPDKLLKGAALGDRDLDRLAVYSAAFSAYPVCRARSSPPRLAPKSARVLRLLLQPGRLAVEILAELRLDTTVLAPTSRRLRLLPKPW